MASAFDDMGDRFLLQEIIITTRKRPESQQNTPVAVTTFSSKELQESGVSDISQIGTSAPNMTFNHTASGYGGTNAAVVFIRGIGQSDFYPHIDPGVGIYLDGVFISRTTGAVLDTIDIEQVEVVRGPQGTLFGKNTIGGAINLTSKKPQDELGGELDITIGEANRHDVRGSIDLPISDAVKTRLTLASFQRDGYIKSLSDGTEFGDVDSLSGRFSLAWMPANDVDVDLALDFSRKREESSGSTLLRVAPGTTLADGTTVFIHNNYVAQDLVATLGPRAFYNDQYITGNPYKTYATGDRSQSDLDIFGASAVVDWDAAAWLAVKSITALRIADVAVYRDADGSPLNIVDFPTVIDQKQYSQEFQFSGKTYDERLNWLVGLFFLKEDIYFDGSVNINFVNIDNSADVGVTSYAIFSQSTYDLTDRLSITAGLRYTYEEKTNDTRIFTIGPNFSNPISPPVGTVLLDDDAKVTFHETTPAISIDYNISKNLMTYFSISNGFKSGGFSQRIAFPRQQAPSFAPETVTSYEVGLKWTGFDQRLRLNAAAYFTDYKDLQVVVFNQIEPINENAGAAEIKGAELELTALFTERLRFTSAFGYTDAKYTEIDSGTLISLDNKLAYTPEWTVNASISYTLPVMEIGELILRADWSYRSKVYFDALNSPDLVQDSYDLFNASVIFNTTDEDWQVRLCARNLTDEAYLVTGFSDLPTNGYSDGTYARPKEWALSISRRF